MENIIPHIILGIVQGLTEFLPVSSTGHLILAREFFHLEGTFGLAEDAVLHLATALAILIYFRNDILKLITGTWQGIKEMLEARALHISESNREFKMALALLIGTIPAVVIGLLFQEYIESILRGSVVVALGLIIGSFVFLYAEYVSKKYETKTDITLKKGLIIGLFQSLALIPGMSRSGMVISGGLLFGLSRVEAARFGFLLSFPIILGAGSLKLMELLSLGAIQTSGIGIVAGAIAAFVSGMAAIHFLLAFVKTNTLVPFVIYRLILSVVIFAFVLL